MEFTVAIDNSTIVAILLVAMVLWMSYRYYRGRKFPASNRTILLTGCDSGLGYATALHLHREGAQVIAACLTHEGARAIEAQAAKHQQRDTGGGGSFRTIMIDVTSPPSIEAAVTRMSELAPHGIDVLVNNAGTMSGSNLFDLTPLPTFQHTLDVNFFGVIRMCKALMPLLKRRARLASGVRIVNVSSFLGRVAPFSLAPYAASKFALEALSDVMRQELSGFNIQVVIVEPGAMKTNMAETMKREQRQGWDAAPASLRCEYGPSYPAALTRAGCLLDLVSRDVAGIVSTLAAAIHARAPHDRYIGGLDALLFIFGSMVAPSWIADRLCLFILGRPKPAFQEEERPEENGDEDKRKKR